MLHLIVDGLKDEEDLVGIALRVADARELIACDSAELRLEVLVCRQMNVEPVAPCLDILLPRRDALHVFEDVLEGVWVVMLEL